MENYLDDAHARQIYEIFLLVVFSKEYSKSNRLLLLSMCNLLAATMEIILSITKSDDKTLMTDSVLLNNEATRNKKRKKNLHEHKSWETVRQNKIKVIDEI